MPCISPPTPSHMDRLVWVMQASSYPRNDQLPSRCSVAVHTLLFPFPLLRLYSPSSFLKDMLSGYDQKTNIVLSGSKVHVYSVYKGTKDYTPCPHLLQRGTTSTTTARCSGQPHFIPLGQEDCGCW